MVDHSAPFPIVEFLRKFRNLKEPKKIDERTKYKLL